MKKHYITYTPDQIDSDNAQNIVLELVARCLVAGDRIIIEQEEKKGEKYIMVDFCPTDMSNPEYEPTYVNERCMISSVDLKSNTTEGKFFSTHTNYIDAINKVCRILRENKWTEIYVETY